MPGPLLAFDAPSLLFRAFYALPDSIKGADGRPVNGVLGSVNLVLRAVEEHSPRAVVACFGPDAAPYRVELYPAYHADREAAVPDGIGHQFELAGEMYSALGWEVDSDDSVEADDLLGSYAAAEEETGGTALILTGDRDMYQCASEAVKVLYVRTGKSGPDVLGPKEVRDRYGVPPEAVPDFIALRGDPSDGIPGAKGIGEKTAADLLRRHGSLEATIKGAIRESRPSVRSALLDQREELLAFKEIATLRDVDVELPPDRPIDTEGAAAAARELGMERLSKRLEGMRLDD